MADKSIVVLISGNGSNLQAIIDAVEDAYINAHISAVISNQPDAYGLIRAQQHNIPAHVINHADYTDRTLFDQALRHCIDQYDPALIVLAGFLRILTPEFVEHYKGRMLNIHPSLLPAYPGLNTHRRAIEAGDTQHGSTVHFVTADLDSGPLIIQARLDVPDTLLSADEAAQQLAIRILEKEHIIYPLAIKWFIEDRLKLSQNGVELDGKLLDKPVLLQNVKEHLPDRSM